ncbi:MAG: DUF6879 family protein [Pseudonocardiaceae bacterium]
MLTVTELNEFASSARDSLFRLETLDRYEVPIDGSDLSVYLAGGEQPHNAAKLAWQEHLRAERAAGICGTECTSSTPPTVWGATCVTNANGIHRDHRRRRGRPHP